MGMFDHVDVDESIELPRLSKERREHMREYDKFQTKDFERTMATYKITKDRRLFKMKARYETVPEQERPYYNDPKAEEQPILKYFGMLRLIEEGWEDTNFHGVLNFYTFIEGDWYEYDAKFTDGDLTSITPVRIEIERRQ
jgi:hypothetical protein